MAVDIPTARKHLRKALRAGSKLESMLEQWERGNVRDGVPLTQQQKDDLVAIGVPLRDSFGTEAQATISNLTP